MLKKETETRFPWQNLDAGGVRRGTIPQPRKSQVVPSTTVSETIPENPELVSWNVRRPSTELLVKSSREKISDCCALFVRDFTRCCDKIYDYSVSTQSKKTSRKKSVHSLLPRSSAATCACVFSVHSSLPSSIHSGSLRFLGSIREGKSLPFEKWDCYPKKLSLWARGGGGGTATTSDNPISRNPEDLGGASSTHRASH